MFRIGRPSGPGTRGQPSTEDDAEEGDQRPKTGTCNDEPERPEQLEDEADNHDGKTEAGIDALNQERSKQKLVAIPVHARLLKEGESLRAGQSERQNRDSDNIVDQT